MMLINDIAGLKAQIGGVQKTMAWPTWEPAVRQSEQKYIIPAIGQELYDQLVGLASPNTVEKLLLDRLKSAVAFFAYLENLPFLMTATGDAGLVINAPGNTQVLSKWLYTAVLKDVTAKADFWLEDSLQYLEEHGASFPVWTSSPNYTLNYGQLIPSASEWTKVFPAAKNSRRLFLTVRQFLFNAEDDFIRPILGEDFYEAIKDRLGVPFMTFTVKESNLLRLCRTALANHGFIQALPYLNMSADFRIVSQTDGIVKEDDVPIDRLNAILKACEEDKAKAVGQLTTYLNANASTVVFPEFFASSLYVSPALGISAGFKNDPSNPFFVL